jgi:hypothetical protein
MRSAFRMPGKNIVIFSACLFPDPVRIGLTDTVPQTPFETPVKPLPVKLI